MRPVTAPGLRPALSRVIQAAIPAVIQAVAQVILNKRFFDLCDRLCQSRFGGG